MNYKKHHKKLIDRAKCRELDCSEYYEKHHIIPKCMGGLDDTSNIVYLTAREHYIVHALLYKIHKHTKYSRKLSYALWYMTTHNTKNRSNNRIYEWNRKLFKKNHPCLCEKTKNKIRKSLQKYYKSDEYLESMKIKRETNPPICVESLCVVCGNIIYSKHQNITKSTIIPKLCSDECKANLPKTDKMKMLYSKSAKKRINKKTPEELSEYMKKTCGSLTKEQNADRIKKISNTKQKQNEKIKNMSDEEFFDVLYKMKKYRKDGKRNGNCVYYLKVRGLDVETYYRKCETE